MLEDLRLSVVALEFITRRGYDAQDDLDRRVEATRQAMDMAFALRTPIVLNHLGQIPAETDPGWPTLLEVLSDLGAYSHKAGAWLAANAASNPPEDFARLFQALPDATLLVDLDPALAVMNGYRPLAYVERFGSSIAHVHARDAAHDARSLRGAETTLGRGEVDFPALLGALEEINYRGYLSLERSFAEDPAFEIERGVKYLKELVLD